MIDTEALADLMTEVGTPGPLDRAWLRRLDALMVDNESCLQLCVAVLHTIMASAVDAGLWDAGAAPVGLFPVPRDDGTTTYGEWTPPPLGHPRMAMMQAFTAAVNGDWDAARAVLSAHIDRGWEDAVPVVLEVMNLWRGHAAALLEVMPADPTDGSPS